MSYVPMNATHLSVLLECRQGTLHARVERLLRHVVARVSPEDFVAGAQTDHPVIAQLVQPQLITVSRRWA